jgi:hypothetical protein
MKMTMLGAGAAWRDDKQIGKAAKTPKGLRRRFMMFVFLISRSDCGMTEKGVRGRSGSGLIFNFMRAARLSQGVTRTPCIEGMDSDRKKER